MQSLIYQYGLLGFILSGFDPVPRQDSAVPVVFLLSSVMSEQLYMVEAFLFVCIISAMYRIENEGKQQVIILKNQFHIQKSFMFVSIVWKNAYKKWV